MIEAQLLVVGNEPQGFQLSLCHQHAVERICMMARKPTSLESMSIGNGKGFNSVFSELRRQKLFRYFRQGQPS